MPPISEARLVTLALDALEEIAAAAHHAPVERKRSLRLVLAFLASRNRHGRAVPRWPYDHFWQWLVHPRQQERWANVNSALNAIYLAAGRRRDMQRVSLFEQAPQND